MQRQIEQGPGRSPRARYGLWVPGALALALLASACAGGSTGGNGVATAGAQSGDNAPGSDKSSQKDPQQAALEFARCMRDHGVDMPDPEVDDKGRMVFRADRGTTKGPSERPVDDEAHKACRHLLDGVASPGDGKIDPAEQDRALRFARCMREQGVDMPDPDFSKGGVTFQIGGDGFDPESPTVKAAQEACKELFGPPGGGPSEEPVRPRSSS